MQAAVQPWRAEHQLVHPRTGQVFPGAENFREVSADARRPSDELAGVNRDSHSGGGNHHGSMR